MAPACITGAVLFVVGGIHMCNDLFSIGPVTIHSYGLCMAIGLIAALLLATYRAKKLGLSEDMCYGIMFCGAICGWGGAKLMYIIVEWDSFIQSPKDFWSTSGFVVFGGITGGFLSVLIYCLVKKQNVLTYLDLCVPSVALAQAFGRIGCFMAGCCYGRPTDAWYGIAFKNSYMAPNNIKLIPTQLISAAGDVLNCVLLILIAKKTKKKGIITVLYLIFYSVGRFLVEFLRDDDRGAVGNLSTSQFYGIFCFAIGVILLIVLCVVKQKPEVKNVEEKNETV